MAHTAFYSSHSGFPALNPTMTPERQFEKNHIVGDDAATKLFCTTKQYFKYLWACEFNTKGNGK